MNTRRGIVFVLVALLLASTMAMEWSVQDDELFSDVVGPASVPPPAATVAQPTPVAVRPIATVAVPVAVDEDTYEDAHEISDEDDHYAMSHHAIAHEHEHAQPVVVAVHPTNGFVPVAPVAPIEEGIQGVYIRARASAITANKQAQAAANANATAAQAQTQAQKALTPKNKREAKLNATRTAAAATMANNNATVAELEAQLTQLRDVAGAYRKRLTKNAESLKNTVSAAEAKRLAALQALADKEVAERNRRRMAREAAERARMMRRKAAAQARHRQHEQMVREIFSEAKNATDAAIRAANIAHYETQLAETRKSIRELKLRILREKATALAQQRAALEKQLHDARTSAHKITYELSRINQEAALTTQSVSAAAAALQALSNGNVIAVAPVAPVVAPIAPVAAPTAPHFAVPTAPNGLYYPHILGATADPTVPVTVPAGSLAPVRIVDPSELSVANPHIFLDNPSQNATAVPAAAAAAAAPAPVNKSVKVPQAAQVAQAASFIEVGLAEADLKLVHSNLEAVHDAVKVARQHEERIQRALNDPRMAEHEFNAVFDAAIEMF